MAYMVKVFNKNIAYLKKHAETCFINSEGKNYNVSYQVKPSNDPENPSLVATEKSITVHSQLYPVKEAEKIVQTTDFQSDVVIIIGLGLGYVVQEIRKKYPDKKLILIEPDLSLFYLAIKFVDLSIIDFSLIYVGYDEEFGVRNSICPNHLLQEGGRFDIYLQKSLERIYGEVYKKIEKEIKICSQDDCVPSKSSQDDCVPSRSSQDDCVPSRSSQDDCVPSYKKFTSEQCRIIFIDSGFILTKECLSAIKNTGNLVHYIHIDEENYDAEVFLQGLLKDIKRFRPDFVLTINHLGFDREGQMVDLFHEIELPYVSWFVDSPNVILSSFKKRTSDFCNIFVWDDDYIGQVKEMGYKNCDFLPLATDTDIFYPNSSPPFPPHSYFMGGANRKSAYPVSFVGSSMSNVIHKTMKSFVHRDDLLLILPKVAKRFFELKTRHVEKALEEFNLQFDSYNQKEDFTATILWKGTQIYRKSGLDKLSGFMPVISGDPNWKNIMPLEYEILPERWYYEDLCDFYNMSQINFNMTSLQMTNAVNQRVFDVSACKKFLLTDYRKQIGDYFESKENMVWFDDVEEIPDLVDFYLKHDNLREKIAANAYEIVVKNHTYKHRIKEMILKLRISNY